jgi:hypothetical protein
MSPLLLPYSAVVSEAEEVLLSYLDQPHKEEGKQEVNVMTGEKKPVTNHRRSNLVVESALYF